MYRNTFFNVNFKVHKLSRISSSKHYKNFILLNNGAVILQYACAKKFIPLAVERNRIRRIFKDIISLSFKSSIGNDLIYSDANNQTNFNFKNTLRIITFILKRNIFYTDNKTIELHALKFLFLLRKNGFEGMNSCNDV